VQLESGHTLEVEPEDTSHSVKCECCDHTTHTIFGFVHYDTGATVSAYCVKWTVDNPEHPPWFLLSIGPWGDGTSGNDRVTVASILRFHESKPNFTVVNAEELEWRDESLVGFHLSREQVMGSPVAKTAFALIDEIVAHDPRVRGFIESQASFDAVRSPH
jgi:hypothetical protein